MQRFKKLLIIFLLAVNNVCAQDNNTTTGIGKGIETDSKSSQNPVSNDANNEINLFDTIKSVSATKFPDVSNYYYECYHTIVNKYGEWQGIGKPLTEQEKRHKNIFFKLLRPKNHSASMPFTHMQIINSFGKLTTAHNYKPHIIPEGSWESKCSEVCQLEKIFINGQFSKENFYNAAGELILSFSGTFVDSAKMVGHYTDASGMMAILRKDKECKYLTIQYDENGYESRISYHDENGYFKFNEDGVHTKLRINDKTGKTIQFMSGNMFGEPSLDNWGNSGWTVKYDNKGYEIEKSCIDQYGHIMPMPGKRKEAGDSESITTVKLNYDWCGNLISQTYYGLDNEKIENKRGIHKFVYKFNNRGQRTMCRAEDLNGKLVAFNDVKTAFWTQDFDKNGNLINTKNYDKDSLLMSEDKYVFKGNNIIRQTKESRVENNMTLTYKAVNTDYVDTIWNYNSKYINITNRDIKGRRISDIYYDLMMKPNAYYSYHKVETKYTDRPGYCMEEECYYDTLGNLSDITSKGYWRSYNRKQTLTDSINNIKTFSEYNGNKLIQKWTRKFDNKGNYGTMIYHDSIGFPGRTIKADALYYRITPNHSITGTSVGWVHENEFGEPSYAISGDWDYANIYCMSVFGASKSTYYDENGDTIPNGLDKMYSFKKNLRKAFCIELIDSIGYNLGLRTGDFIVAYGDWKYNYPSTAGGYWENMLCFESMLKADTIKKAIVMRFDSELRKQVIKEINLPKGTPQQLGFIYHMLYLTKKETDRYKELTTQYTCSLKLTNENSDYEENDKILFIKPCKVGSSSNKQVFNNGFKENAIALEWIKFKDNKSYRLNIVDNYLGDSITDTFIKGKYDSIVLHYTTDGYIIKRHVFKEDNFRFYINRSTTRVPNGEIIHGLAKTLLENPHPMAYLTPEHTMNTLLKISGTKETTDSISKKISINYYEMTDEEMFYTRELFAGIDYSGYIYTATLDKLKPYSRAFLYVKPYKDKISEIIITHNGKSIERFISDIGLDSCILQRLKVVPNGQFGRKGIKGEHVILKCNNWKFGMPFDELKNEMQKDINKNFIIAEVTKRKDGTMTLGKAKSYSFEKGLLGIIWGWEYYPVNILFEADKRTKRIKEQYNN